MCLGGDFIFRNALILSEQLGASTVFCQAFSLIACEADLLSHRASVEEFVCFILVSRQLKDRFSAR
jgi:hypothetical protein